MFRIDIYVKYLSVSSTDRPTGRSFIVICLKTPLPSMMKSPYDKCRQRKARGKQKSLT